MEDLNEIVMTFVLLWLIWSLVRGLSYDFFGIGHEPGRAPEDDLYNDRTFLQRKKARLMLAYPFMGFVIVCLLYWLLV